MPRNIIVIPTVTWFHSAALFLFSILAVVSSSSDTFAINAPSPRNGMAMVFDSDHHQVILYGGSDSAWVRVSDTWIWKDRQWKQAEVDGPGPRQDAQLAYDS